ncbi:hypothetical protein, partial [Aquitalea pelogenes]|uniref:hypothetical protein n=1 Tax=Aquitalea pelogenes TaxID=1293573 RepID=UPI0019597AFC
AQQPLHPKLAGRLLADCVAAALLRVQQQRPALDNATMTDWCGQWLDAMQLVAGFSLPEQMLQPAAIASLRQQARGNWWRWPTACMPSYSPAAIAPQAGRPLVGRLCGRRLVAGAAAASGAG